MRQRSRARRVPQASAAELRGVRRAALLRAVHRRRSAVRRGGRARRGVDLRGRVEPDRPDRHAGRGWRRVRREHQRVAVLRRADPRAGDDARDACGRRVGPGAVREPRRWPGRAGLRRRVDALRRRRAPRRPRPAVRGRPARRRRRRPSRVPPPAARPTRARSRRPVARGDGERTATGRTRRLGSGRTVARAGARGLRSARARHARLRAEERRRRRVRRDLGRHRLVARGHDRGRRARARARHRRADAVALLERGQHHRRRRRSPPTSASGR